MGLNYNYKGALEPVKVKVVRFCGCADYIFSLDQWKSSGGWLGLIKSGEIHLRDVVKVIDGQMNPNEFNNLPEWDG